MVAANLIHFIMLILMQISYIDMKFDEVVFCKACGLLKLTTNNSKNLFSFYTYIKFMKSCFTFLLICVNEKPKKLYLILHRLIKIVLLRYEFYKRPRELFIFHVKFYNTSERFSRLSLFSISSYIHLIEKWMVRSESSHVPKI